MALFIYNLDLLPALNWMVLCYYVMVTLLQEDRVSQLPWKHEEINAFTDLVAGRLLTPLHRLVTGSLLACFPVPPARRRFQSNRWDLGQSLEPALLIGCGASTLRREGAQVPPPGRVCFCSAASLIRRRKGEGRTAVGSEAAAAVAKRFCGFFSSGDPGA